MRPRSGKRFALAASRALALALAAAVSLLAACASSDHGPATAPEPGSSAQGAEAPRHVVVLHTNDVHGQVLPRLATWLKDANPPLESGGLPRVAAAIRRLRAELEADGAAVFVCDGGDWFQGTPEGQVERGAAFLEMLAAAGHDALVVGNHEFDHGLDVLLSHLKRVPMPALLANVRLPDGAPLPGTRDALVVERGGVRVAFVGLLTPETPSITHVDTRSLLWEEPTEALVRVRAGLPADVDLIVPVTHIGVEGERALARSAPDLPLVVGGHSHTFLRTGVREGDALVVQAGAKASVLGRVDLWLDGEGAVVRSEASHVELYAEPEPRWRNTRVDALADALVARAAARMDEVVGELTAPLEQTRRELVNSTAGNLIADAIRERAGADVAVHNRGGIRAALPAGPITRRDLFSILPFDNHVTTVTLTGEELVELFRTSVEDGRRGALEFSGARLVVRREEGRPRLVEVLVGGLPVAPGDRVRLATNSFLATGGDGWQVLGEAPEREEDVVMLRDLLEERLLTGPVTPPSEQRYDVVR
ncbi:MAG: bifunctional UDP-sugar hydrolase/5'-nucleotidase [Planctomycetota bacterium]